MADVIPYDSVTQAEPAGYSARFGQTFLRTIILLFLFFYFTPTHMGDASDSRPEAFHTVKQGDTLSEIALKYKVSVEQLKDWNGLQGDRIYKGQRLAIQAPSGLDTYVVRSGDTLSEIASRFGIPLSTIRDFNDIYRDRIYPGQKLHLYQDAGNNTEPVTYVVGKGDTLWSISQRYGLTVPEIKELNDLKSEAIIPGMTLQVGAVSTEQEAEEEEEDFEYVVKRGDSLWTIAQRFNIGVNLLRQLNNLDGEQIIPGKRLQVRPSSLDEGVYVVRAGDTLSAIAFKYNIEVSQLREINGIQGSKIQVGDKLRLRKTPVATHIVEQGDALWEIARTYGISVDDLVQLNGLSSHRIYPGQELQLGKMPSNPLDVYTVNEGDYLERIARLHQMSVADLKKVNNLSSPVIHPGDKLKVTPLLGSGIKLSGTDDINWEELIVSQSRTGAIDADNGPYYNSRPGAAYQRHADYYENPGLTPLQSYRQARELWEDFEKEVDELGRVSNALSGWYFVLDPGHGGLDPGAVVEVMDGNGNSVYVVEDEYVYDIALRIYVLLRTHGANVNITLFSPNHLIRQSSPPTKTFVNEKNEVFNDYQFNKENLWKNWPTGGSNGNLSKRVEIAREFFKNTPENRRVFISCRY